MKPRDEIRMKLWCDVYITALAGKFCDALAPANLAVQAFDVTFPKPEGECGPPPPSNTMMTTG